MIQIVDLFDHLNIPYKTSGKNVSSGWCEISCVYCQDSSKHLGVDLKKGSFHCWVCGEKGRIEKLITKIEDCSYREANQIIQQFSDDIIYLDEEKESPIISGNILPKEATKELPLLHWNYLVGRNFDPKKIQKQHQIMACYAVGNYAYRLIIPIVMNDIIVNFTARDVSGQQEPKYKNCPNNQAVVPMKECLYNIDTVRDKTVIVEGPTDAWRIGRGCCATMGVEYTSTQMSMLANKSLEEIYIMYDEDAILKAEKIAIAVSAFCQKVEIIEIQGDPGDMSDEDALKIRKEIGI